MSSPENAFYGRVKKYLDSLRKAGVPLWYYRTYGGGRTKRGLPDLCVVLAGRAVFIELKAPGGKPTAIQLHRCREIEKAGGVAFVASCIGFVHHMLRQVAETANLSFDARVALGKVEDV